MVSSAMKCVRRLVFGVWLVGGVAWGQCPVKVAKDHVTLGYQFVPVIDGSASTMHVKVTVQGAAGDEFGLRMPGEASRETVSPWVNLKAESGDTSISRDEKGERVVRFKTGKAAVFSYDLLKNWPGALMNHMQFNPVIYPDYFELFGGNALARPHLNGDVVVTANFDWRALPAGWTLATSFGAGSDAASRCQSVTGLRDLALDDALFAGGDFRLHTFKVGERDVDLAIRGSWSFTDEEAEEQLKKPIALARAFWHDDNFPYFLVTLAPFGNDSGTDGTAYTHSFWFFMGPKDTLAEPRVQKDLIHEAFHEWDPRRMGVQIEPQEKSDWFQEGVTDYYANLLAYRGGLLKAQEYADAVNRGLANYASGTKSDYSKGLALGVWLDSAIRAHSAGKQTLDDAMYEMVRGAGEPLTEERVLRTLDGYLAPEDRERLRAGIDHGAALPLAGATVAAPCMQVVEEEVAAYDLGLDFNKSKAAKVITDVEVDGPAYKAGLRDGQKLVSWSVVTPSTEKLEVYTVKDAEGEKERKLSYYAKKMVLAPKLHPGPEGCMVR